MRILLVLSIAGLSLAAGALVERVKAEQAFLCEGGRIVYGRGAEVEQLKLTDPCVAGYFGITLERGADPAIVKPAMPAELRATAVETPPAPSPVRDAARPEIKILNSRPGDDTWRASSR